MATSALANRSRIKRSTLGGIVESWGSPDTYEYELVPETLCTHVGIKQMVHFKPKVNLSQKHIFGHGYI
jgi:hypothetical protein